MNHPRESSTPKAKNLLEWTVFALSLALIVSIASYLGYDAWTHPGGPPRIELELGQAWAETRGFALPVTAYNSGSDSAELVRIEVTLVPHQGSPEVASYEIQELPRGARRRGIVTFESDPRQAAELVLRVLGYQLP